jgi:hypothetical protein
LIAVVLGFVSAIAWQQYRQTTQGRRVDRLIKGKLQAYSPVREWYRERAVVIGKV